MGLECRAWDEKTSFGFLRIYTECIEHKCERWNNAMPQLYGRGSTPGEGGLLSINVKINVVDVLASRTTSPSPAAVLMTLQWQMNGTMPMTHDNIPVIRTTLWRHSEITQRQEDDLTCVFLKVANRQLPREPFLWSYLAFMNEETLILAP